MDYKVIINDGKLTVKLTSNYIITSDTMITTEDYTYTGTDITTTQIPNGNMLFVFNGASPLYEGIDYTRVNNQFTFTSPIVENGDLLRFTYTY